MWVPFNDRVPNDRPFHKCNKFGDLDVDCYCTNVIVYMCKQTYDIQQKRIKSIVDTSLLKFMC